MYLLFNKPNELPSVRVYKIENILSLRGREQRAITAWHDVSCAVESLSCGSPGQGYFTSQGFPELKKQTA